MMLTRAVVFAALLCMCGAVQLRDVGAGDGCCKSFDKIEGLNITNDEQDRWLCCTNLDATKFTKGYHCTLQFVATGDGLSATGIDLTINYWDNTMNKITLQPSLTPAKKGFVFTNEIYFNPAVAGTLNFFQISGKSQDANAVVHFSMYYPKCAQTVV
eukprot:NODE_8768_length_683_cov_92.442857_g8510_i0.p1 GENE.NODE_8768_length_683_cov_92.442857_g8510_i0~~NODE_8768_length_683_cov_92.442857_g8510_i0.p1  ORF type:complete len:157 (+),score=33.33 NODE_8768_length_683_cov_92.442857_g8510_i0:76-546(+)